MTSLADLPVAFFQGQDRLQGPLVPELVAPSSKAEIVGFPPMDIAGHGEFGRAFYSAFPDIFHTIDEVVVAEPYVTARFTLRGTQTGSFMQIPPTGRPIVVQAFCLMTVDGGRVSHLRAIFDQLGMMRQLGVIPS
jgi:predicted ester cyclase